MESWETSTWRCFRRSLEEKGEWREEQCKEEEEEEETAAVEEGKGGREEGYIWRYRSSRRERIIEITESAVTLYQGLAPAVFRFARCT